MNVKKEYLAEETSKLLLKFNSKTLAEKLVRCKSENETMRNELKELREGYHSLLAVSDYNDQKAKYLKKVIDNNNVHKYVLKIKEIVKDCHNCRWFGGMCPVEAHSIDDEDCVTAVKTSIYTFYHYEIIEDELVGITTDLSKKICDSLISCVDIETGEVLYLDEEGEAKLE